MFGNYNLVPKGNVSTLAHDKQVHKEYLALSEQFDKLIISLRTAYAK